MANMRGFDGAHAWLLAKDPGCELTKTALRRLVVSGEIESVRIGKKYLIDMDVLEAYLSSPRRPKPVEDLYQSSKIKKIAV